MTLQYGYRAGHVIKRIVLALGFAALLIWGMFSVYRFVAIVVLMGLCVAGPRWVHREIVRRVCASDGFRLITFSNGPQAFVSSSFDWPWWSELYGYRGAAVSASGEEFDYWFTVQGPLFALVCPTVGCYVRFFSIQAECGKALSCEEIARRLQNLRAVKHLRLDLSYGMTDDKLVQIENWENLEFLSLGFTKVTDRGLEHLKGLTRLKELDLYETETTVEGRNMLRNALPECAISPAD